MYPSVHRFDVGEDESISKSIDSAKAWNSDWKKVLHLSVAAVEVRMYVVRRDFSLI